MPASRLRPAAGILFAGLAGGCTVEGFAYTLDRYNTVRAVQVRLGCNDTYEVFDRKTDGALLVSINPISEALGCGPTADLPRPERQRRVAAIYLEESSNRPLCRLAGERELAPHLREFSYTCPGGTAPAPTPGRARRS